MIIKCKFLELSFDLENYISISKTTVIYRYPAVQTKTHTEYKSQRIGVYKNGQCPDF